MCFGEYAGKLWKRLNQPLPHRIAARLSIVVLASCLDYFFTCYHLKHGASEMNPVLAPLFHGGHYFQAFWLKMGLTLGGVTALGLFHSRPLALRSLFLIICMYLGILTYHIAFM
ncbi:MAG TPA: hypothetical protein EYP57_03005 [Thermodesulfobacteriaceae bacterium]|nr:hypothetical protein [Thermodesulfobacteriaceae bacterium]